MGETAVSEAQPPQTTPNASSPVQKLALVLAAFKSDMARTLRLLEISVVVLGSIALCALVFWTVLTGNDIPLTYMYGVLLFMGGGMILVNIGSLRWPYRKRNGHPIPKIRYAGMICLGVAMCLPSISEAVGFPPAGDLIRWLLVLFYFGAGLMLASLAPWWRRRGL